MRPLDDYDRRLMLRLQKPDAGPEAAGALLGAWRTLRICARNPYPAGYPDPARDRALKRAELAAARLLPGEEEQCLEWAEKWRDPESQLYASPGEGEQQA
jgi:hypothetical protein